MCGIVLFMRSCVVVLPYSSLFEVTVNTPGSNILRISTSPGYFTSTLYVQIVYSPTFPQSDI